MGKEGQILSSGLILDLIAAYRQNKRVFLVCRGDVDDFKRARIYEMRRIGAGAAIEVVDDANEVIEIDRSYPYLDHFVAACDEVTAKEESMALRILSLNDLNESFSRFSTEHLFSQGQAVRWKRGMAVSNVPASNEPAIVVRLLDKPVTDDGLHLLDPARTLSCDMVVGCIHQGNFVTSYADSRRFEPFPVQPSPQLA